jgi:hypothetical protein
MEIGKPRNGNVIDFSARLAHQSIPDGVGYRKAAKSRLWRPPTPRRPVTRSFDLSGSCSMELGLTLAREALDRGDWEFAEQVLNRLRSSKVKKAL